MIKESEILHERGDYWVLRVRPDVFEVRKNVTTHSIEDSAYDDVSLAIARCDYLATKRKGLK